MKFLVACLCVVAAHLIQAAPSDPQPDPAPAPAPVGPANPDDQPAWDLINGVKCALEAICLAAQETPAAAAGLNGFIAECNGILARLAAGDSTAAADAAPTVSSISSNIQPYWDQIFNRQFPQTKEEAILVCGNVLKAVTGIKAVFCASNPELDPAITGYQGQLQAAIDAVSSPNYTQ